VEVAQVVLSKMSFVCPPSSFYKTTHDKQCSLKKVPIDVFLPKRFLSITGPTLEWKVFSRQNEAVKYAKDFGQDLMAFAFQRSDGTRGFLAAHPVVFWWHDSRKEPSDRRTFEVIAENEPCKLYLDLEFDRLLNPNHDGVRMTNTFITILCAVLKREFEVDCARKSVLDLDSTTDSKFSRHLIFLIEKSCFRNNYHVGSFVRMVCQEIRTGQCLFGLPPENIKELFVKDKKNNVALFCDEGVYTKNRHFRLFQSTKWNKKAPLLISAENQYNPCRSGSKESAKDEHLFLDSLVTFTSQCRDVILEFADATCSTSARKEGGKTLSNTPIQSDMHLGSSPIPVVDKFIQELVLPGYVRRWAYFIENNTLDYDIVGNRFCHNIGRAHKSNNVKYVVDLRKGVYYQKCYDSDCAGYRSPETKLPPKILFLIDNDDSGLREVAELSDKDLTEVWESVNALFEEEAQPMSVEDFPDFGLSDEDLLNSSMDI